MKKIIVASLLAMLPMVAMADNDVGCGLGTQIFAGKSGLVFKVLAATTNGTLGNQTFGITFNTLGCSSNGVIRAEARLGEFMGKNGFAVARDMSQGQGESLSVVADLIGVQAADKAHFAEVAKQNFTAIYTSNSTTAGDAIEALKAVMAKDQVLSQYVTAA